MSIGMYDIFKEIIDETVSRCFIMEKVKQGEELTKEEYEQLLQSIYSESKDNASKLNELTSLKSQLLFTGLGILTKPAKSCSGVSQATSVMRRGAKEYRDNYQQVLKGVTITSNNLTKDNAHTLVLQRDEANKYGDKYQGFLLEFGKRINDYRRDYQSPIAIEEVQAMQESRDKIVELSGQYVKKR